MCISQSNSLSVTVSSQIRGFANRNLATVSERIPNFETITTVFMSTSYTSLLLEEVLLLPYMGGCDEVTYEVYLKIVIFFSLLSFLIQNCL